MQPKRKWITRRGAIMAGQWGHQLAQQRRRPGFAQAGLAEIMGKLELIADIGGHLLKMPANPAA